ncbi:MAG: cupin domain-containing protein, partial [Trichodesmium sp. MAG_R04]|nr:cupin domain-containing protein [Trichodesmium sp. MAG_R04]
FDVGGKTPLHQHHFAVEMFFILKGEGRASCDGKSIKISGGDSILMPPTSNHIIENIGSSRLYALCIMVPNEDFAELIKSGTPVDLDEEDMQVLNSSNFTKFLQKREGK